jgi:hypothetical protein
LGHLRAVELFGLSVGTTDDTAAAAPQALAGMASSCTSTKPWRVWLAPVHRPSLGGYGSLLYIDQALAGMARSCTSTRGHTPTCTQTGARPATAFIVASVMVICSSCGRLRSSSSSGVLGNSM